MYLIPFCLPRRGKVLLRRKENLRKLYEYYYTNMCKIFLIGINITSSDTRYLSIRDERGQNDWYIVIARRKRRRKKRKKNSTFLLKSLKIRTIGKIFRSESKVYRLLLLSYWPCSFASWLKEEVCGWWLYSIRISLEIGVRFLEC